MTGKKVTSDAAHDKADDEGAKAARSTAHIAEATVCHDIESIRPLNKRGL